MLHNESYRPFEKIRLTESFVLKNSIDKVSAVNQSLIRNHILTNFSLVNRYKDDQYWYMSDYLKIPYHQHIQWTQDYLRDHYRLEFGQTLVPTPNDSIRGVILQSGEQTNVHHNVKDWHLEESPEVSCLYCVGTGAKPSNVIFEFDDGRNKHKRWKVPLEKDNFILYSSHLNHYISKNENRDFSVYLSLHFQLI